MKIDGEEYEIEDPDIAEIHDSNFCEWSGVAVRLSDGKKFACSWSAFRDNDDDYYGFKLEEEL